MQAPHSLNIPGYRDTFTFVTGGITQPVIAWLQVSDPEKGVLGTGAHSDYGLMTMLATVSHHPAVSASDIRARCM